MKSMMSNARIQVKYTQYVLPTISKQVRARILSQIYNVYAKHYITAQRKTFISDEVILQYLSSLYTAIAQKF